MGKLTAFFLALALAGSLYAQTPINKIPAMKCIAMDGHNVELPRDLASESTVLIVGFSKNSKTSTTAWGKAVMTGLATSPSIGYYDIAMLAEVPGFLRSYVTKSIRKQLPEVLWKNFLPLTRDADAWKTAAGYEAKSSDAAYVLLVDHRGTVHWRTHEPYSTSAFASLAAEVRHLVSSGQVKP